MSLGTNLKRLRGNARLTQGNLSERSGVRVAHISKLERDDSDPKLSTITKLMNALGCSADQLIDDPSEEGLRSELRSAASRACSTLPPRDIYELIMLIGKYQIARNTYMSFDEHKYYEELERMCELDEREEHLG